jgi:F420-non-reducing hydrogenase iron-sulfur subunit
VYVLEAFQKGADGVFIGGCHPRDCHYLEGNYKTLRRILLLKKLLPQLGIEPERLKLEWVSAAEGQRFAQVVTDFISEVKKLGPSPLKKDADKLTKVAHQAETVTAAVHK